MPTYLLAVVGCVRLEPPLCHVLIEPSNEEIGPGFGLQVRLRTEEADLAGVERELTGLLGGRHRRRSVRRPGQQQGRAAWPTCAICGGQKNRKQSDVSLFKQFSYSAYF